MQRTSLLLVVILLLNVAASALLIHRPPAPPEPPTKRSSKLSLSPYADGGTTSPEPAAEVTEPTSEDFLSLARKAMWRGDLDHAMEMYKDALLFDPGNVDALNMLGRYYYTYRQYTPDPNTPDSAYNYYMALHERYPTELEHYYQVAVVLIKADRLREAEAWAHRGLALPQGVANPGRFYAMLTHIYKLMGREALQQDFERLSFESLGPDAFKYFEPALETF